MNMSRCIQGYSSVLSIDITPSESFTRHELSAAFGTSLVDEQGALSCDIGICWTGVGGFGFKLLSPVGVFSAELSALFMALWHIREVIQPPEKRLMLTDSLDLIKAIYPQEFGGQLIRSYMNASNCALILWEIWLRWNLCGFRPMWGWCVVKWFHFWQTTVVVWFPKLDKASFVKGMAEEVGFDRH
jgi:hypothetical protein